MPRKKILWLCSWYPNRIDPFDGDFIQRHAKAASLFNDIYVIRVVADDHDVITDAVKTEMHPSTGLTEHIIYFSKKTSLIGKIKGYRKWRSLFKKAVDQYVKENGIPHVMHVHVPMRAGIIAAWAKYKYKIHYFLTEHLGIYNEVVDDRYSRKSHFYQKITLLIFKGAVRFFTVSQFLGEAVKKLGLTNNYSIIPNTVDTSHFFYKEKTTPRFRFIHVSNMVPLKNVEGILKAAEALQQSMPGFELVIIGPYKGNTTRGENIFFRGEIPYKKVAEEMQQSNALILFSDIENSPCVIGEAHCCGLPVIATDTGGIPELITSSNGVLVEPRNTGQLTAAMKKMMEQYNSYDRFSIADTAKNKYSYEVVGKMFDEAYSR